MKKSVFFIFVTCFSVISVYALSNNFDIDASKFSYSSDSKKSDVTDEFDKKYGLTYNISSSNKELEEKIIDLSKKVTYLLLGQSDTSNETAEEYYERRHEYLNLRYNPKIPKDSNTYTGLDENSEEYKDDLVSGISVPGLFNQLDELNITYQSIGSVRVSFNEDFVMSMVSLPNITIKEENKDNVFEYRKVKTNLVLFYYFKKLDNEYKLYYLFAEKTDDLGEYFDDIESSENSKQISFSKKYDSNLNNVYDFSKLEKLSDNEINQIYKNNLKNVLMINAYYNNTLSSSANGILLDDGLVVTTWNFLENALINSQYFVIKDNDGVSYEYEGIITINPESDIAVIKLKEDVKSSIKLGNIDDVNIEDPVLAFSSKTGVGLTLQAGIMTAKDGYVQCALPLVESDQGSPLFNSKGELIGLNTSKSVNTSISMAVNVNALEEICNKFSSIDFNSIKSISFEQLKEKYYYTKYNKEKNVNGIPKSKWKKIKKIGNIDDTIKLELVKSSYDKGIVSLRYYNGISDYISGMQLAVSFKEELKKSGYKQTLDSSSKCIYVNDDYKIIIMDEFAYLIVVMVKL